MKFYKLGTTDHVPVELAMKWLVDESLDVEQLSASLQALLANDFWPLAGTLNLRKRRIEVDDDINALRHSSENVLRVVERRDLTREIVRAACARVGAHGVA